MSYRLCYIATAVPSAIRGGLNAVELRVLSASRHQIVVSADLYDTSAVQDHDAIGHAHCGEPVRDEEGDPAVRSVATDDGGVALEQRVFGLCVERGRRFVEHPQQRSA